MVKDSLIELLENNRGKYISGEQIAHSLGCSRNAVWKAVESLRKDGYAIIGIKNKGYMFDENADWIRGKAIKENLGKYKDMITLSVNREVSSTNIWAKELAENSAPEGTVVIASAQSNGRGRLGRSFYSPAGTGLYMSMVLRPNLPADEAVKITTAAAVAVAQTIEAVSTKEPGIKWVNDIYIDNKKVCGILTEASVDMESGILSYAVLGIGINVYQPKNDFPVEIKDIAGAVFKTQTPNLRNVIAAEVIKRFMGHYKEIVQMKKSSYLESYRRFLMWKGEKIYIISGEKKVPCKLIDVDDKCRLLAEFEDGTVKTVSTGEISIRKEVLQ